MHSFFVGICHVVLYLRHAQTLKDKRQFVQGIKQKLRNQGFSVTECGYSDVPKQASIGFSYSGSSHSYVQKMVDDGARLFEHLEVTHLKKEVYDSQDEAEYEPDPESRDE